MKANKIDLEKMETKLEESFISWHIWQKLQKSFDQMLVDFDQVRMDYRQELHQYREHETELIDENIKQSIRDHFSRYELVYKEFKKFFNLEGLYDMFDKKAT